MDNKDKAKIVIDIVRRQVINKAEHYINAKADLAKAAMGKEMWAEQNHDDLGFGRNPYNTDLAQKRVDSTYKEKCAGDEVLKYTIDVFINKMPNDSN